MENESVERIEKAEGAGEQQVKTGPGGIAPPMEDYDDLNVRQATERLDSLSGEELGRVKSYEQEHKNRKTLIAELDKRLAAQEQQETVVEAVEKGPAAEEKQETVIEAVEKRLAVEEQQATVIEAMDKKPAAEEQQEGEMNGAWFSTYRNWILAAVGAVVLLWLIL